MKVLVVEDSERLRKALGEGLKRSGFVVDSAADGQTGLNYANGVEYDVIVLDIMLPKLDGLSLLKEIRDQRNPAQVLILSARDQIDDRVEGLEAGADDYLVKPFAFEELVARIKTLGRRRFTATNPVIEIENVRVDTSRRQLRVNDDAIALTAAEYNLIEYLSLRRGSVVPKNQLHEMLSNTESESVSNVVEVLVSNVRKKLREAGTPSIIKTKRGFGYYIE